MKYSKKELLEMIKISRKVIITMFVIIILLGGGLIYSVVSLNKLKDTTEGTVIETITSSNLEKRISELESEVENMAKEKEAMYNKLSKLESDNLVLANIAKLFQIRTDLWNKYEFALFYDGARTDIDYEHLTMLESMAANNCYGTDTVALTLALVMKESHGDAQASNAKSNAAGLGQLMNSTAKDSYETLLGNGLNAYESSYAFNPELNLKMSLAYVNYLAKQYKGDPIMVIDHYRGFHSDIYIEDIRKILDSAGLELNALELY